MARKTGNLAELLEILEKQYPDAGTTLSFSSPFELLIATILSAQASDSLVNRITNCLFEKYRTPADFLARTEQEVMQDIRSLNFYRTKARNIRRLCEILVSEFDGRVPDTMEDLVGLPGVARKTANVVLSQAFGKSTGIVVDTHVRRVSRRLGLTSSENPVRIEQDLMAALPKSVWIAFPYRLILHGRKVCRARSPLCETCVLCALCPSCSDRTGAGRRGGVKP